MSLVAIALLGVLNGAPSQEPPAPRVETRTEVRVITAGGGDGAGRLDTNGDGFVTREEFSAPMGRAFDRLDTDHDGRLSTEELAAGPGPGGPGIHVFAREGHGGPGMPMIFHGTGSGEGSGVQVFTMRRDGPDGGPPPPPGGAGQQIFVRRFGGPDGPGDMDKDGDRKVSEAEFLAPLREAFQRMDVDGDGFMDGGEGRPAGPAPSSSAD